MAKLTITVPAHVAAAGKALKALNRAMGQPGMDHLEREHIRRACNGLVDAFPVLIDCR